MASAPTIPYTVRRSPRARRARLTVTRDGSVSVVLPRSAPPGWADELVAARQDWIRRHVDRARRERERVESRPTLEEGGRLLFAGVPHVVEVAPDPRRRRSRIEHDDAVAPTIRVRLAAGDERPLAAVLEPWLRGEARTAVDRRIAVRARDLRVVPGRVAIRDQRSRWGSASRRGTLSFSWRLILMPPAVLDYVVVHELAHLRDMSHSPAFWVLVRSVVPDAARARLWLRTHEADVREALR